MVDVRIEEVLTYSHCECWEPQVFSHHEETFLPFRVTAGVQYKLKCSSTQLMSPDISKWQVNIHPVKPRQVVGKVKIRLTMRRFHVTAQVWVCGHSERWVIFFKMRKCLRDSQWEWMSIFSILTLMKMHIHRRKWKHILIQLQHLIG